MYALFIPDLGDFTFYLTKTEVRKLLVGEKLSCELLIARDDRFVIEGKASLEIKEAQPESTCFDTTLWNSCRDVYPYYLSREFVKNCLSSDEKLTISDGLMSHRMGNFREEFWIGTYPEALLKRRLLSSFYIEAKNLLTTHRT